MKKYTKKQIIDMLERNCLFDTDFGGETNEYGEFINLKNGITMHVISDEEDYNMLCDLLEIPESER